MASSGKHQTVAAAVSGMRRVDCIRMVEDDRTRFFVVGVGHRFPVEREVSASVALQLLGTVPCRYERPRVESPRFESPRFESPRFESPRFESVVG
jgi:hypothetical protein